MKTLFLGAAALVLFLCNIAATPTRTNYKVKDSYHSDFRSTPKILFNVNYKRKDPKSKESIGKSKLAETYIKEHSKLFSVNPNDLVFVRKQSSLLGKHYRYKQMAAGYEVYGGEIVVSVDEAEESVARVFNSTYPVSSKIHELVDKKTISISKAYDIVWRDLHVQGKLIERPSIRKVFYPTKHGLILSYLVRVAVEKPFGYWQYMLNAVNGKILEREDRRLTRQRVERSFFKAKNGDMWPRAAEFNRFKVVGSLQNKSAEGERAQGQALVFDPDPRTTLKSSSLQDDSSAIEFEAAYFDRPLADITKVNGRYELKGPWVTIADFESPSTAPSTTTDGVWSKKRGNNAFNDVMTYYHIDKNQRYMQSLGFVGEKGIQQTSVFIDSDGVNGQDNSHYVPSSNRIAFGHGCVDDNEDADVILHEYGHAINYSINSNWSGGDTGAMGEGFGDYWAGSYSITTNNGDSFKVNEVFSWDGHGDGNSCWGGRMLNKRDARYDHSKFYRAHTPIDNGDSSDELWSTPLFQSLLELIEKGYSREEVDRIVLEAQFGLGSALKMRDMANAIVRTAERLYPGQEHSEVFVKHFVHHGIIELPAARFSLARIEFENAGDNGRPDPGENFAMGLGLKNVGTEAANTIRGTLSAVSENVEIDSSAVEFTSAGIGEIAESRTGFRVGIGSGFECGADAELKLKLDFNGGALGSQDVPIQLSTGVARMGQGSRSHGAGLEIPDQNEEGVASKVKLDSSEMVKSLRVSLNIQHTFIGDLTVVLTAPNGKSVALHRRSGGSDDSIKGVYPDSLEPDESLNKLVGAPIGGEWKLKVADTVLRDTGALKSWGIEAVAGYDCDGD